MAARFPFLDHVGPLAFAHQGGALERPENSLAAFAHAVDLGYRYLETDVRLSADHRVVVIHDAALDRVSDGSGAVAAYTWDELSRVRLLAPDGTVSDEGLPLLEDVLTRWPDVRVNVDAKDWRVAAPLAALVQRLGVTDRVCLGAFDERRVRALRHHVGRELCTALGPVDVGRLVATARGLRTGRPWGACAQVPVRHGRVEVVTPAFLAAAHRYGVPVVVWTIDDEAEMHRLLDLGVDGLMTNRPTLLRAVLESRGQWS